MVPLVNEKITNLIKLTYFGPILITAYTLTTINSLTVFDFVGLILAVLGTFAVVKSKLDLGIAHTWAGYCSKASKLEVTGIYAYIRHPLYTGVHLFCIGELFVLIFHAPWYLTLIAFVMGFCLVSFLTVSASKETNYLTKHLGEHFINYKNQVHPFLPLKKYT